MTEKAGRAFRRAVDVRLQIHSEGIWAWLQTELCSPVAFAGMIAAAIGVLRHEPRLMTLGIEVAGASVAVFVLLLAVEFALYRRNSRHVPAEDEPAALAPDCIDDWQANHEQ